MKFEMEASELKELPSVLGCAGARGLWRVTTDSRQALKGEVFLPLVGERFDGHDFIGDAQAHGAGVIFQHGRLPGPRPCRWAEVTDTLQFLHELAAQKMGKWKKQGGVVLAITGSNGKTTCKEFLAQIIKSPSVYSTPGNFNNTIGLPICVLNLRPHHRWAIFELGTNSPGEIHTLCKICLPDVGLITNIGRAHLEGLGHLQGVLQEKSALFYYVAKHSQRKFRFLLNAYDPLLKSLPPKEGVTVFGEGGKYGYRLQDQGLKLLIGPNREISLSNGHIFGKHNLANLALCLALALELEVVQEGEVAKLATEVAPSAPNRSTWIRWKGLRVFLDAYNANPTSMAASLQAFEEYRLKQGIPKESVGYIIGDMNELGACSEVCHEEVGRALSQRGGRCFFVGAHRAHYQKGLGGQALTFASVEQLKQGPPELFEGLHYLFVKGSRSVALETLF